MCSQTRRMFSAASSFLPTFSTLPLKLVLWLLLPPFQPKQKKISSTALIFNQDNYLILGGKGERGKENDGELMRWLELTASPELSKDRLGKVEGV